MKKTFCDICGEETAPRQVRTGEIIDAIFSVIKAEDVCKKCEDAATCIAPAEILKTAIIDLARLREIEISTQPERPALALAHESEPEPELEGLNQKTVEEGGCNETLKKEPKKKGASGRLYEYIRAHPEPGVLIRIADATGGKLTEDNIRDMVNGKAQCGHWFAVAGKALDILESESSQPEPPAKKPGMTINADFEAAVKQMEEEAKTKKVGKGMLPDFWGSQATSIDSVGVVDEAKLRRKTQAALANYTAKHGQNYKQIIKATCNRVTAETIRAILADCDAGRLAHIQAVDRALKKLALEEVQREGIA